MNKPRGFAVMKPADVKRIAAMGGRASHGGGRKPKQKVEDENNA